MKPRTSIAPHKTAPAVSHHLMLPASLCPLHLHPTPMLPTSASAIMALDLGVGSWSVPSADLIWGADIAPTSTENVSLCIQYHLIPHGTTQFWSSARLSALGASYFTSLLGGQ